ncbi:hypothetical protein A2276_00065 [candidate division WOR-1 bacterium RIFOXYA12_FULL_43_27]|uniref:Uncharacterized protein n=1 Tax=candidate division WOR-1 bacterium RIFOXYC2_FULL_46_14 TaxID=1802587 RepID=A0A1F4U469_UNCSA|nr:MAG: hypothetical protein A2276_00065 [candidate division WOR-1 bacterium RIFOXYA12_FULL_43_27]OGC20904.1 MAG: hypothetical protein A2292_07805 [candidate division WOR-1 bacterium RIFOXYB2_FULL_46_45]OGC31358.1 MAG: hypothetical protein A2232_03640 [candidate division WOR-1 bacterium RIFOXYA2_FULL_46_56]OGC39764.1 MAG: hypothetical protein A2438_04475 [candidate division WOR-1 bacterium RIFOXYC2_FULL_46_14]
MGKLYSGFYADKLLRHFSPSCSGISCTYYNNIRAVGFGRKHVFPEQRVSPIVIGHHQDLSFYQVRGKPENADSEISMPYLKEYLLIPTKTGKLVFVSDDHTHAAFAWALAKETGIIGENAVLIHIDSHPDHDPCRASSRGLKGFPLSLKEIASITWEEVEICNFIDFGQRIGAIDPHALFYFIHPFFNGRGIETKKFYSDSDNNYTSSCLDLTELSLEKYREAIDKSRREGKPVVLDLDLDFFCPHYNHPEDPKYNKEADIERIIEIARQADFITIATSPSYFLVPNQQQETRHLIQRIVSSL